MRLTMPSRLRLAKLSLLLLATASGALHVRAPARTTRLAAVLQAPPQPAVTSPPPQPPASTPNKLVAGFAYLAGVADTVTYHRHNMYANMMTGNTINFAYSLGSGLWLDCFFYISIILSYVGGIAAFRRVDLRREYALSTVAPLVLVLFTLTDIITLRSGGSRWAMLCVVSASGLVNAACADATGTITAMLTGHCQKLGNFVTDAVSGAANYADGVAARKSLFVMAIFAFGVASGAAFERLVPLAIRSAFPIPAYSVLGVAYAAMLVLNDRRWPGWFGRLVRRPKDGATVEQACTLDDLETECIPSGARSE